MCGIAGIVSSDGISAVDRRTTERMLEQLTHRGPDDVGMHACANAVLGHTRLGIIDPVGGKQPIRNEDGSVWTVINGEIYNYRELRRELEGRGHRFRSNADSEVVVHLYEDLGPGCVERLRGMFAVAIWDGSQRTLVLARDPIGVKPLYYAQVGDRLVFASQLNALLEEPTIDRDVDPESLHNYLVYHYVPAPGSILRGVSKLGAAERLVAYDGVSRIERYWDVSFQPDDRRSDADWFELIRQRFDDAVGAHLVADVPVGALLSGGMDSSAVVEAMVRLAEGSSRTYTAGFSEAAYDEREDARALADRLGTVHADTLVEARTEEMVEAVAGCFDEPFADPSAVPTYCISGLAAGHVKAVLSGDGGDEVFAGYTRYLRHARERTLRRVAASRLARGAIRRCAAGMGRRVRSAVHNLTADADRAHYLSVAWFDPEETRSLLAQDTIAALGDHDPFDVVARHFARCDSADRLSRGQYVDVNTWLADGVLCKTDRASMAHGLEVRVPLLDTQWVTAMAALPARLKIRAGRGKHAFREAMLPRLGAEIVRRRKRGFAVPLDAWFAGPLRSMAWDLLGSREARIYRWLDPGAVRDVWAQFDGGRRGLGSRLWALLMLEVWARRYLTAPAHHEDSPAYDPVLAPAGAIA